MMKLFNKLAGFLFVGCLLAASTAQAAQPSESNATNLFLPAIASPIEFKEWKLHKTDDGSHPDGSEQQLVWLMNRARANPMQEGIWLATSSESDIAGGRGYFGVNTSLLQSEFAGYAAKPPAAFDVRLYNAAKVHSDDLIARDAQDHKDQFLKIQQAGFHYWGGRGNVFSYARNSLYAHAAFNIDWGGNDGTGMQTGRGHRMAIMSVDGDYTNVGFAMVPENNPETSVGPLVTTENFCRADEQYPDHFNRFIVGTVWRDNNANGLYDPGEGIGNVTVTPSQGQYFAVTSVGGGYAIPIETPGDYTLIFSGAASGSVNVTVGSVSVLADLQVTAASTSQSGKAVPGDVYTPIAPPPGIREP
jgi:hypothetical protein